MLMATIMTSSYFLFLMICIIIIISSYPANVASSKTTPVKPRGLAIKLIHHDSIQSPYYNPNSTISERAERAIKGSLARIRSLSKRIATPNDNDVRAGLVSSNGAYGFLANISIGTPPVLQLLHIDTASDLFWFQCLPCTGCSEQSPPLFDPAKSTTYSNIPCDSITCRNSSNKCDAFDKNCIYEISYLDASSSTGNLASEQATFETSDEGTIKVPINVLGCGHENSLGTEVQESGVLGLGHDDTFPSLVSQLGSKFSYCIGNIHDPQYQYNNLILGDGAIMEGDSTTLETYDGFYYVNLQGISVGEKALEIDPGAFQRGASGAGGVIIDSGATYTTLTEEGYMPLQYEVETLMAGILKRVSDPELLCYTGSVDRDLSGFPVVTLQFADGAQLGLDVNSMFFQKSENVLCMSILQTSSDYKGASVIGVTAQQHYNVGYDINQGKIFFQRIDCDMLESLI